MTDVNVVPAGADVTVPDLPVLLPNGMPAAVTARWDFTDKLDQNIGRKARKMPDLRTPEAEDALREHLAVVRGHDPEPGTMYHETITAFRHALVQSALMWDKTSAPYRAAMFAWLDERRAAGQAGLKEPVRPPEAVRDADTACMMASSYAYTLAAVIRLAGEKFGREAARVLATAADDILTNGDFDSLNADVMPDGEPAPGATQGIEIVLPPPATRNGET